jgi:hypothetical protein
VFPGCRIPANEDLTRLAVRVAEGDLTILIEAVTARLPQLRFDDQSSLHWIHVHVVQSPLGSVKNAQRYARRKRGGEWWAILLVAGWRGAARMRQRKRKPAYRQALDFYPGLPAWANFWRAYGARSLG